MLKVIVVRGYRTGDEAGWDVGSADAADYRSERAARLYEALGADPEDTEYTLAFRVESPEDKYALVTEPRRWALFGLTVGGHPMAEEVEE